MPKTPVVPIYIYHYLDSFLIISILMKLIKNVKSDKYNFSFYKQNNRTRGKVFGVLNFSNTVFCNLYPNIKKNTKFRLHSASVIVLNTATFSSLNHCHRLSSCGENLIKLVHTIVHVKLMGNRIMDFPRLICLKIYICPYH